MKHYVLTRSAYGPEWSPQANQRRIAITKAVTARLMARQTTRDWTWLVVVHPADVHLAARLDVFRSAGVPVIAIEWNPPTVEPASWATSPVYSSQVQKVAATAYRAPWRSFMEAGDVLQTRIDDDDGFAVDALERFQRAAEGLTARRVLMLTEGFRISAGRYVRVHQANNAMHSLFTPAGDDLCVYDYGHTHTALPGHQDLRPGQKPRPHRVHPRAPASVTFVDDRPAWLWVRHRDTISGHQKAYLPITKELRRLFPIDWSAL